MQRVRVSYPAVLPAFALALTSLLAPPPASAQALDPLQHAVDTALTPSIRNGVPATFASLHGTADHGIVTLTGSADRYSAKLDAEANVARIPGVRGIDDRIVVNSAPVDDATLQSQLQHKVHTRNIAVTVRRGNVMLSGTNVDSGVANRIYLAVADTPGVRAITSNLGRLKAPNGTSASPLYTVSSLP